MTEAERVIQAYSILGHAGVPGQDATSRLLAALRALGYAHEDVVAAFKLPPEHRGPFWREVLPAQVDL